jgi:hypothetical protein
MGRSVRHVLLTVSVAGLAMMGLATSANAGAPLAAPLTIAKVVHGPVPPGTTFTARLDCGDGNTIIQGPDGPASFVDVTFNAAGEATTQATFGFGGPGDCTVTETASGGAATVSYSCVGDPGSDAAANIQPAAVVTPENPCDTAGPQADPIEVAIFNETQSATVTIDNTFVAPPPTPEPQAEAATTTIVQPSFPG